MCSEPATRAPANGLASPYRSRIAIRPGISCSANPISVRPKSANDTSATLKSMNILKLGVNVSRVPAGLLCLGYPGTSGTRGPRSVTRPGVGEVAGAIDVRLDVDHLGDRLRLADRSLGRVNHVGHLPGCGFPGDARLHRDQQLLGAEMERLHVDDAFDPGGVLQGGADPRLRFGGGGLPEQQAFCLLYTSDAADDLLCVDL